MEQDIILSICISSYNRSEKVELLVKEILKSKSTKISVVVVDDFSEDDTIKKLKQISDNRLLIFQNKKNVGAKKNWYNTIEKGNGKFILHVLDRDWINIKYIDELLNELENIDIGFGYVGDIFSKGIVVNNEKKYQIFEKGKEASKMWALTAIHPTGFFSKKILLVFNKK